MKIIWNIINLLLCKQIGILELVKDGKLFISQYTYALLQQLRRRHESNKYINN